MPTQTEQINIVELLMKIKEDVSSIKTDMANFKEAQRTEKEAIMREIADVRGDCKRDISALENSVMGRISSLQNIQKKLVSDVNTLKQADELKDAKKWRKIMAFVGTALSGVIVAKLPDVINYLIRG